MIERTRLLTAEEVQALVDGLPPAEVMLAGVPERPCACCGTDIRLLQRDAIYCGSACRLRAWRGRHGT